MEIVQGRLWNGERERVSIGTSIVQLLQVSTETWLVREDYYQFPRGVSTVYCIDRDLRTVWSAPLPKSDDVFCNDAEIIDGQLFVWTWNGYRCRLDLHSGKILEWTFTK